MTNPILGALNQNKLSSMAQQIAPIKQMMNTVRSAGNPDAMLSQMMASNPKFQQVQNFVQQYGGDAKAAFYALAEQQGVNPEQILSMLR